MEANQKQKLDCRSRGNVFKYQKEECRHRSVRYDDAFGELFAIRTDPTVRLASNGGTASARRHAGACQDAAGNVGETARTYAKLWNDAVTIFES